MTKKELEKLKKLLDKKKYEMIGDLRRHQIELAATLKDSNGQNTAYSFHMADVGTDNMEREKAFFFATREGKFLTHIHEAEQRMENGIYGMCLDCKNQISLERLEAVPTATRCVPCKEKDDGNNGQLK